ncbi:hypothetical protein F53441_11219 [Fusarium austroafricanum]|uniref:Uncharacterized protein n=1 Tax=Fusarium austroafricanum TaxID=2364996 RepID=A0A8H4K619_9HYPO|nr:hypothetical protein F53441_11219 [Fusarium austroafricanum]
MEEQIQALVKWAEASTKSSPYIWSAAGLTFLIGVQVVLAVAVLHGDEATVRRQLIYLQRIDVDKDSPNDQKDAKREEKTTKDSQIDHATNISPVASCAPVLLDEGKYPEAKATYDNSYMFAIESSQTDDQGFAIWTTLDQQTKPALTQIKTELWLPKSNANKRDPLVKSGGCIVMTFADPAVPGWLDQIAGLMGKNMKEPQVACILPLRPTLDDIEEHKLSMRPFKIDGEDGKGLDMEKLPAFSDILPKLRLFLGYSERQAITIFKRY